MEESEEKPKKKRKKKAAAEGDGGGQKEHRSNWRETRATYEDIQNYLNDLIHLRHNVITGQQEFRVPEMDPFSLLARLYPTGATPLDEWRSLDTWQTVNDRLVNSLLMVISQLKDTSDNAIWKVIGSDFVPLFNPFTHYLRRLPPWDESTNPILDLSMTVTVKGSQDEQLLFYVCLRKWLVGMVAGWLEEGKVNQEILVLVGRQGIYKTTWFSHLMPPELQPYFHSNTSFGNMTKDEVLKLSQYGLICCEELDTMKPSEMNRLKWAVTTTVTDERRAYAHTSERRKHIASYCGTGNNIRFIDDDTGTRRWLPFEVESIRSPHEYPFDHQAVFAQAYALYLQGFRYWFDEQEMQLMSRHNERFEVAKLEREAICRYYRPPRDGERGEFVGTPEIMEKVGGLMTQRLTTNKLGRAMTALGFESMRARGQRGYVVIAYQGDEIKANRSLLASDAKPESEVTSVSASEIFDTNDTIF